MIKLMDLVDMNILMAQNMKDTGKKISNMVTEKKYGQMEHSLRVITLMEKNKVKVNLLGQMVAHIRVTFMKTTFMAEEYIDGPMGEYIMVLGSAIRCMVMECLHGQMEEGMKENM